MVWIAVTILVLAAGALWMILDSITNVRIDLSDEIADVRADLDSRISSLEEKLDC